MDESYARQRQVEAVSGAPSYGKPGSNLPPGIKPQSVPPEIKAKIEKRCSEMFGALNHAGNSKAAVEAIIEALLSHIQATVFKHLGDFSTQELNGLNTDLILLTALTRVALNNPMWNSDALMLQLRTECHHILQAAGGVSLDGKD